MKTHVLSKADEGMLVGAAGAIGVALWFLGVDVIAGAPLRTPSVLGQVLLLGSQHPVFAPIDYTAIILYTAFHFALFFALGILLASLARNAEHNALVRYAILMVFVAFEVIVAGTLTAFSTQSGPLFPVGLIVGANTVAVVVMAVMLWRMHPAIAAAIKETPLGAAPRK